MDDPDEAGNAFLYFSYIVHHRLIFSLSIEIRGQWIYNNKNRRNIALKHFFLAERREDPYERHN